MKLRVLIVEIGERLHPRLRTRLEDAVDIVSVNSAAEALQAMDKGHFDLAVMACGAADRETACRLCASLTDLTYAALPIVVSMQTNDMQDCVACLRAGADVCLPAGVPAEEFVATCRALVAKTQLRYSASPLTKLPGNVYLHQQIAARLPARGQLAVLALDLTGFKAYNDHYGYARGDEVLSWMAGVLRQVVAEQGTEDDFAAHIGGDDFFVVTTPERAEHIARALIQRFDKGIIGFYDKKDRTQGGIWSWTRRGEPAFFPICSLVVAGVTNVPADIRHPGQISQILAELKQYGKAMGASVYVPDRRRDHSTYRAATKVRDNKAEGSGRAPAGG